MMEEAKKSKPLRLLTVLLSVAAVAAMLWCAPYFKDDWAWGSQVGLERLQSHFTGYNGRYLGNLLVMVLTRSLPVKIILMTAGVLALPLLVSRLANKKLFLLFPLSLLGVAVMPADLFRQTVVWASGFSNYMPPVLLTLCYLLLVWDLWDDTAPVQSKWSPLCALLIGGCGALFMEHVTLYNLALAVAVLIFSKVKHHKTYATHWCFLAGAVIGAGIMFTNSAYGFISSGKDQFTYRSMAVGGTVQRYFDTIGGNIIRISNYLTECNALMNVLLAALFCIVLHRLFKKGGVTKGRRVWLIVSAGILVAYAAYSCVLTVWAKIAGNNDARDAIDPAWRFTFTLLFSIALLLCILLGIQSRRRKGQMLFALVSVYVFCTPLFIVTPLTARCFLPCYAMFMLLAALLFDLIYRDTADKTKATRTAGAVFAACLIALGVFYATVFVQIKDYSVGREAYVQAQIDRGEKKIYLPMYPAYTGDYIRGSTPKDGSVWEERYKMFYHIDPDIDLVTVGPNTPQAKAVLAQEK